MKLDKKANQKPRTKQRQNLINSKGTEEESWNGVDKIWNNLIFNSRYTVQIHGGMNWGA